jgi:DNA-binding CsgD family transcriptional regulator
MPEDPYSDPVTGVLYNTLGLGTAAELEAAEREITHAALILLHESPVSPSYDLSHLQEIHKRIFGDIYEWAGQIRTVAIAKGAMFCLPQYIDSSAAVIFRQLRNEGLLRGDTGAAESRRRLLEAITAGIGSVDFARESAQRAAELALWAGRPGDALAEVQRVLPLFTVPDLTISCGRLLAAGMRACADLAEQARARRDAPAAENAAAAADGLALWVRQMAGAPFADHPFVATIPAERATWDAEQNRLAGPSDPAAWAGAAKAWQDLGCPHRAGYAWWRQAQAQLDAGQPPTVAAGALRAAAAAAHGHQPLLAQVRTLADRARIPLQPPAATGRKAPPQAATPAPYGLTGRELAVLRLVAAGRSNAQIGAELFISRGTAAVHVTSILRKLGVTSRVQAAALAERAGLLDNPQP